MEKNEFELMIAAGENRFREFKAACPVDTKNALFLEVVKAMLGMSNTSDGGRVIVGIENGPPPKASGLTSELLADWTDDHVSDCVKNYADPSVAFVLRHIDYQGAWVVEINVAEFDVVPVICKKEGGNGILKEGKCYIRSRRKAETVEVQTQEDMRDLIDLATTKRLTKLLRQVEKAGGIIVPTAPPPRPEELYQAERKSF